MKKNKNDVRIKKLEISNFIDKFVKTTALNMVFAKKPLLYRLVSWFINKNKDIKKLLLLDFINETNGRHIIKIGFTNNENETFEIESRGMILNDLELESE